MKKYAIILLLGALAGTPAAADNFENFRDQKQQNQMYENEQKKGGYEGGCDFGCQMFGDIIVEIMKAERARRLRLQQ